MNRKSSYNSIGYHLHAIASIICGRTERVMYKYKMAVFGILIGAGIVFLAVGVPNIKVSTPTEVSPSYSTPNDTGYIYNYSTPANQTDTVDTDLQNVTDLNGNTIDWNSNQTTSSIHFEFSGVAYGNNTLAGFQCNLDASEWIPCNKHVTVQNVSSGQHSFEVRAVDDNGNPDWTPSAFVWIVK